MSHGGAEVTPFDVAALRKDFPLLDREVNGKRIVYLDSGASSLPPHQVVEAMSEYYETTHANVHRGVYHTAEVATERFELARRKVGRFLGAPDPDHEVVFTKNCTEAFNLLAHSWGRTNLLPGDVVVLSELEHHANIVPWLQLRAERDIELRFLEVGEDYRLDLSQLDATVEGAKLVSVSAMSNVLGTITPLRELAAAAHRAGALIAVDGAQSVPHLPTDVVDLDLDFLCFSGHKMLGPTGIGVLWARAELLEAMPPFLGGGGMILDVRTDGFLAAGPPARFEAGTPPIAEAIGLGAAVDYLEGLTMTAVAAHDQALTAYALDAMSARFGSRLQIFGPPAGPDRGGVLSMALDQVHAHDLAQVLDQSGVCVRPGHHCAKPLMRKLGLSATARASFGVYSDRDDVDALLDGLEAAGTLFST